MEARRVAFSFSIPGWRTRTSKSFSRSLLLAVGYKWVLQTAQVTSANQGDGRGGQPRAGSATGLRPISILIPPVGYRGFSLTISLQEAEYRWPRK